MKYDPVHIGCKYFLKQLPIENNSSSNKSEISLMFAFPMHILLKQSEYHFACIVSFFSPYEIEVFAAQFDFGCGPHTFQYLSKKL